MAIYATCPDCDTSQKLRDDQEGTKVKCKECGTSFRARADEEDEKPRRRRGRDTEDELSKGGWGLIIGLIGGAVLLIGVVVVVIFMMRGPQQPNAGGNDGGKDGTKDGSKDGSKDGKKPAPSADVVAPAAAHQEMEFLDQTSRAVVSSSNLVVLSRGAVAAFSLADGRKLAQFEFPKATAGKGRKVAVSPDGSRIAVLLIGRSADNNTHYREITVYSVPGDAASARQWAPRPPWNFREENSGLFNTTWLDFLDNDRIIHLTSWARVAVYSLKAGKDLYDERPANLGRFDPLYADMKSEEPSNFALSPDRSRLSIQVGMGITLVETANGKAVGKLPPAKTPGTNYSLMGGMAFSPDGKRLAAVVPTSAFPPKPALVIWGLDTQKLQTQTNLPDWGPASRALRWWGNDHVLQLGKDGEFLVLNATSGQAVRHLLTTTQEPFVTGHPDGKLRQLLRLPAERKPALVVYPAPDDHLKNDKVVDDGAGSVRRIALTHEGVDRRDLHPPKDPKDKIPLPKR